MGELNQKPISLGILQAISKKVYEFEEESFLKMNKNNPLLVVMSILFYSLFNIFNFYEGAGCAQ